MSERTRESGGELQRMYERRFAGRLSYRDRVWNTLIKHYFAQWVKQTDVVLDLGAGYGEFINHVVCRTKYAMDLNPETSLRANSDITVIVQDCSKPWPLQNDSLDVIFTSNFFEHLPDKAALAETLAEAYRCLKPGGRLIAMGPNIKYVPGVYWDFWDHYTPLTERSLEEGMVQQGFHPECRIDKFLPFTMADGPHYPTFFVALYLRLPFAWRIFGKQFLVITRKGTA